MENKLRVTNCASNIAAYFDNLLICGFNKCLNNRLSPSIAIWSGQTMNACRLLRFRNATVEVHVGPTREPRVQSGVHTLAEQGGAGIPDSFRSVEGHRRSVGQDKKQSDHDLRQAGTIVEVCVSVVSPKPYIKWALKFFNRYTCRVSVCGSAIET